MTRLTMIPLLWMASHLSLTAATQFGGAVTLPFPTNVIESVLIPQWRAGALTWIRTSSALLASHGFNQSGVLAWAPPSTRTHGGQDLPDDLLALYWHCRTNLPVFPGIKQAWEVWNEPDFFFVRENPDRMAAVAKAAYWGIKAGNSNAIVLMPSLAFTPGKYHAELLANNAFAYTEGYNFHFYGWAQDFIPTVRQHQQFLRNHTLNFPLWITEAGYFHMLRVDADNPAELARQQAFHERITMTARALGIDVYLAFILTPFTEAGFDLGMVTDLLVPRPALDSYLELAAALPDLEPVSQIWHLPTNTEIGLVFRENDEAWRTVLWTPHRWKETAIPALSTRQITNVATAPGSTALEVSLRFSAANKLVQFPRNPAAESGRVEEVRSIVSAETNLHIRTSAVPFDIKDCEWRPILAGPTRAAPASPTFEALPSPVILQMNYNPTEITADKPSQTYRFYADAPVHARLSLYNLSETQQTGRWSVQIPPGWVARVVPKPGFAGISKQSPEGHRRRTRGGASVRIALPPLSRTDIFLVLTPPSLAGSGFVRAAQNLTRAQINCRWQGSNGFGDVCANWLEPHRDFPPPNLSFAAAGWLPSPETPNQWKVVDQGHGAVQLILDQETPPSGFASIFYVLPENVHLKPEDLFCAEMRAAASADVSYRVNLLTPGREVFRNSEDEHFGQSWTRIVWRVGDFGAALWTQLRPDYRVPFADLRIVRISFQGLAIGDSIEIRNAGFIAEW